MGLVTAFLVALPFSVEQKQLNLFLGDFVVLKLFLS
jgi:hypothetical protein